MKQILEKIQSHFQKQLPFAVYNKPDSGIVKGFFQKNTNLYSIHDFNESGFAFADFTGSKKILIPKDHSEYITEVFTSSETKLTQKISTKIKFSLEENVQADFKNLVEKAVVAIGDNQIKKVVISRKEEAQISNYKVSKIFEDLVHTYSSAFCYCFYHPEIGLWFGATPERLLQVRSNSFQTIALAGTQKYDGKNEVTWENKEQEEQQFVTDFILENLENVTSDIAFSNPYTYKAGNLLHIKTDISGILNDGSDINELLKILHPTPAVCGLPKTSALEFILKNETYDRKFYAGFLGELNLDDDSEKQTDLFVNLRCMEILGNTVYFYMGCGITKDSDPEKEYIETVNKSMTMKNILNHE